MPRIEVLVDENACNGCGLCVELCPAMVFELSGGKVAVRRPAECILCGGCVPLCPRGAIRLLVDGKVIGAALSRPRASDS